MNSSLENSETDSTFNFHPLQHSTPLRGFSSLSESSTVSMLQNSLTSDSSIAFIDAEEMPANNTPPNLLASTEDSQESTIAFIDISLSRTSECTASSSSFGDCAKYTYSAACCSNRCIAAMSLPELELIHKSFSNKTRVEQRQFLSNIVLASAKRNFDSLSINGYALFGRKLCKKALLSVLGISPKRLRTATRLVTAGATTTATCSRVNFERKSNKLHIACAWMENYFKRLGDRMPHTQQIHLPSFLSKKTVYELMIDELARQGLANDQMLSLSHFYALWKDCYSNCIIPKVASYNNYNY